MAYKIKLDIFEGPLDLLLYLVKKDHINICDIPIAKVTEQYLAYLELMRLLDLEIAGQFLVVASTLLQIKSRMLLPKSQISTEEEEVDPREELVQRLLEYQRFKEIASELRQREQRQQQQFKRPPGDKPPVDADSPQEVYFEASIFDLINAFTQALKDVPRELFYEVIKDEFTLEDFRDQLRQIKKLGPLEDIMGMIPGLGKMKGMKALRPDEGQLVRLEAIVNSMTNEERRTPRIINGSRRLRIATGSGTTVQDVNRLLKQFAMTKKMIKQFSKRGGKGISPNMFPL